MTRLLRVICHENLLVAVEGDLYQLFQKHLDTRGRLIASIIYFLNILQFMQPFSFKSPHYYRSVYQTYIKVILRNIKRKKLITALNVSGMSIAFLIAITIFSYVSHELSYDRYHQNADRIYRLTYRYQNQSGYDIHWARMNQNWINQIPSAFPEVEALVRFQSFRQRDVKVGEQNFRETHAYAVDKQVFDLFDYTLVNGSLDESLDPYTAVLTTTTANRYFGEKNPVGETIYVSNDAGEKEAYMVTAVVEDPPSNSHIPITLLTSINNATDRIGWAYTYLLLKENGNIDDLSNKMPEFISTNQTLQAGEELTFHFQPLTDIHLRSHLSRELVANGDIKNVIIFVSVGFFLLVIASVNFINLNTIQSMDRIKELGLRKYMGATKGELKTYFALESLTLSFISAIVALICFLLGLSYFEKFIGQPLVFHYSELIGLVLLLLIAVSLVSAVISNQLLTRVNFNRLANWLTASFGYKDPKKRILLGLQFSTVLLLISSMIVMQRQFNFMSQKKLGYNEEQILVLRNNDRDVMRKYETMKSELKRITGIQDVSAIMEMPTDAVKDQGPVSVDGNPQPSISADIQVIDLNATELLEIEFLAGNGLPQFLQEKTDQPDSILWQKFGTKDRAYLINESAAKGLGWSPDEAIEHEINWAIGNFALQKGPVVGVIKDFHQESFAEEVRPLVLIYEPLWTTNILVKAQTNDVFELHQAIEEYWKKTFPNEVLELTYLDQELEQLYLSEKKQLQLISAFTFTAILIAFMGLYAIIAYSIKLRLKELAIRKVLGSHWLDSAKLLSKEYLILVLVSMGVVYPITFWIMNNWLSNYAYHIFINGTAFLIAGAMLLLIVFLTLFYHVTKNENSNPTLVLNSE